MLLVGCYFGRKLTILLLPSKPSEFCPFYFNAIVGEQEAWVYLCIASLNSSTASLPHIEHLKYSTNSTVHFHLLRRNPFQFSHELAWPSPNAGNTATSEPYDLTMHRRFSGAPWTRTQHRGRDQTARTKRWHLLPAFQVMTLLTVIWPNTFSASSTRITPLAIPREAVTRVLRIFRYSCAVQKAVVEGDERSEGNVVAWWGRHPPIASMRASARLPRSSAPRRRHSSSLVVTSDLVSPECHWTRGSESRSSAKGEWKHYSWQYRISLIFLKLFLKITAKYFSLLP